MDYPKGEQTYTFSNRYNGADLIFLFKEGWSLILRRLSFNSNRSFLFFLVRTLKFSNYEEWLQNNKWLLTALPSGLTFFLVNDDIHVLIHMLSNSYIKVSDVFTIIGFITESALKFINATRCKFLGSTIFKTKRLY